MFLRQCFGRKKIVENNQVEEISKFECLPNELIFIIFEYMNCYEIISTFINLNDRLQSLLSSYSSYHLSNSPQLTKTIFELMQKLSLRIKTVQSLTLFYSLDSIIDVDQFFSIYPLNFFYIKLKVLSLHLDRNLPTSLILILPNFQQLTHLSMVSIKKHDRFTEFADEHIFHTIFFEIKTLKYLKCDIRLTFPSIDFEQISTIEYLELYHITFTQLYWLCLRLPNLKSIAIEDPMFSFDQYQPQIFEQVNCLKLNFLNFLDNVQKSFEYLKYFTHLKHLQLQGKFLYQSQPINGYQLANFIRQYIPQLKVFKFFFIIYQNWFGDINIFIQSFQTDFWLIEKQCFITCNYQDQTKTLYYYTEPCIRHNLEFTAPAPWIQLSTSTQTNKSTIDELILSRIDSVFLPSFDHFSNIRSLTLFNISPNVTYNQLNRYINLSSIKHLYWQSKANNKLFFDILKYCSSNISLHISSILLLDIINYSKQKYMQYLKKITSLNITYHQRNQYNKKAICCWCSCFPNVKQLFLPQGFTQIEISYIINSFESLSFLFVVCGRLILTDEFTFVDSLVRHKNKSVCKENIFYRWHVDELYIWFE